MATLSVMPPGRTPATMPSGMPTPSATTSPPRARLIVYGSWLLISATTVWFEL